MKILAIGDVVGPAAIEYLARNLGEFRRREGIDLVIANGENASVGNGLTAADAGSLLAAGADVITTGNHVWKWRDLRDLLDDRRDIVRPLNYPASAPGRGGAVIEARGRAVLVMNVMGTSYGEPLGDPFDAVERELAANAGRYDVAVLDVHAEATGEKAAIARFFDGRIAAVFGTHTHVRTADARVLPGGTGFITDLGMTGPGDGILGVRADCIIERLRTHMPTRFELASGPVTASGAVFDLDPAANRAVSVVPVEF